MQEALLDLAVRDKKGNLKQKNGSYYYQLKFREKPELPEIFTELKATIEVDNILANEDLGFFGALCTTEMFPVGDKNIRRGPS